MTAWFVPRTTIFTTILILSTQMPCRAQEKLTLSDAIAQALQYNFSLNISRDSARVAANNNTAGNAGELPQVGAFGGISTARNNIHQAFSGRPNVITRGASSTSESASLQVNYVLFNGLKMFAARKRLQELEYLGRNNSNLQVESVVSSVMASYFSVLRVIQNELVSNESIKINDERIKIAQTKFQVGAGNKIDLLQAEVDRNQSESILMAQQITLDSAKIFLNQLIGKQAEADWEPADTSLDVNFLPTYVSLLDSATKNSFALRSAAAVVRLSEFTLRTVRADQYPVIAANAGYYYNLSKNSAGFSLYNQSVGPQVGFTLNWNVFNGGDVRRRIKNAALTRHVAELQYQNTYTLLVAQLSAQYKNYENLLATLKLEERNVTVARENLNIALAKYRLGASTQIDLMTAEQSLTASLNRLVLARFKAKIAETNLYRLSGALVVHPA